MKRSAPAEAPAKRTSLPQVSCQLCRARKLKCDREQPCFNCSSRNVDCIYRTDQGQNSQIHLQTPIHSESRHFCERDCGGLVERIRRLEAAVFPTQVPETTNQVPSSTRLIATTNSSSRGLNQDDEQQRTSQWLEDISLDPHASDGFKNDGMSRAQVKPSVGLETGAILRELPIQKDAELLLDHFIRTFDSLYRTLHIPTTWRGLRDLYNDLNASRIPSNTQLAFFLSIFAGGAYLSRTSFQLESVHLREKSLISLGEAWLKKSSDLLAEPPVPPSTQALQTYTILTHLSLQMEGFSRNFNHIAMSVLHMAKVMRIHRLDTPTYREERQRYGADMVDIEIKRRVWWHFVASDWLLSPMGGPHEGTYMLHPNQMQVLHPSNVEDDDIPTGITHVAEESYNLPLSTPTSMSYSLHRIKIATLSREVIDNLSPSFFAAPGADSGDDTYNKILASDQKYQQFFKSLPSFYQLNSRQDTNEYESLIKERPYLKWQRYLLNFIVHTHVAKLHRPFLIRGSTQPKFAYSRMQCLRSIETVLEMKDQIISENNIGGFSYVLVHFLMSAIILAMDVCYNPGEIAVSRRKEDVLKVCRMLEDELNARIGPPDSTQEHSTSQWIRKSFQMALQNLRGILRRNKEKHQVTGTRDTIEIRQDISSSSLSTTTSPNRRRQVPVIGDVGSISEIAVQPQSGMYPPINRSTSQQEDESFNQPGEQILFTPPPPPYQQSQTISGDIQESEFTSNDVWDEFFALGPNFDSSDWDTFLIDVDEQIAGLGAK